MNISHYIESFNYVFTLFVVFPAIVCIGSYLSVKLRCIQLTQLKQSFLFLIQRKSKGEGNISRFGAISAVLSGNFGTGNISGIAVAITTGGPGALVWMWVMAFFGAVIQYASCVLGHSFRQKTQKNEYVGGPMYYLRDGLGYKKIAAMFALFTICGSITVGNFAQVNSVVLPLVKMGFHPLSCSLGVAALIGLVVLGGIQRIAFFASYVVPFKAFLYLITAALVIGLNHSQIVPALKILFAHAFGFSSVTGGVLGFSVFKAMTTGFDRGLFATDAGTGIVPILQASAKSDQPTHDGISTLLTPFLVMIVCTMTGLVIIMTGAWLIPDLESTNIVTYAFSSGLHSEIGRYIVILALGLFGFTTMLAWSYCGEKASTFLFGESRGKWFKFVFLAMIPLGSLIQVQMIWVLADTAIAFMLIANLIGVTKLSHYVIAQSRPLKKQVQQSS